MAELSYPVCRLPPAPRLPHRNVVRVKGTDECKNTFRRGRRYTVTVGKTLQHMRAAVHRVQGPAQWGGDSRRKEEGKMALLVQAVVQR